MSFFDLKRYLKTAQKPLYSFGGLSSQPKNQTKIGQTQVSIVQNDLTLEEVEAIVNAANSFLSHGGGVAGAISRKGGKIIQQQSDEIIKKRNKIKNGDSVTTDAGKLPCKKVIHTVGPIWEDGNSNEKEELARCMKTILEEAQKYELKTLSIPAISSGIFGFPKDLCAKILLSETQNLLKSQYSDYFKEIRFCNFDNETVQVFIQEFENQFEKKEKEEEEEEQKQEDLKEQEKPTILNQDASKISNLTGNNEGQAQDQEKNEADIKEITKSQNEDSESQKLGSTENLQQKEIPNIQTEQKKQLVEEDTLEDAQAKLNNSDKKVPQENNNSKTSCYVKQNLGDSAIDFKSQEQSEKTGQESQSGEAQLNQQVKL
ncbi:hypothetical protein ABPG74_015210 [Tetrahymena malaccensis]